VEHHMLKADPILEGWCVIVDLSLLAECNKQQLCSLWISNNLKHSEKNTNIFIPHKLLFFKQIIYRVYNWMWNLHIDSTNPLLDALLDGNWWYCLSAIFRPKLPCDYTLLSGWHQLLHINQWLPLLHHIQFHIKPALFIYGRQFLSHQTCK
jgi:hypothetical protein